MAESEAAKGLRSLLERLTKFRVLVWGSASSNPDLTTDRVEAEMGQAHVVSSLRSDGRHAVVIDIDHPTWLVKSTTPDHYHLYIDVPGGIEWLKYTALLHALADAGVIERGYADASIQRSHSDVRLPWIKKPAPPAQIPVPVSGNRFDEVEDDY